MFKQGSALITNWKNNRDKISALFKERKSQTAKKPLLENAEKFMQTVYILNHHSWNEEANFSKDIENFIHKPFNVSERLQFIVDNAEHYHSYIQLNELFNEIEKIYARVEILEVKKHK
ncbi:hypothetical protein GH741_07040 [Aquibacillus halophilus]|uniref:YpoC-like domain-containing protein n=1 Tax=Aquibacillus halophilus TaxID=930132 RepID=A0A6A8DA28_9BACI|nr:hypothetical protein [Aquibacillus halophilus]MRH42438.1 hypothetical protein [Aquibacillus halophilus]